MTAALKAIEDGSSVSRASRDFGVPRSTLHDRVSGRVVHGVKPGPKPYLDNTEEKELGSYLKHCAKVGYGKTRKDVLCIVELRRVRGVAFVLVMCPMGGGGDSRSVRETCR